MRLNRCKVDSARQAAVYVCQSRAIDNLRPFEGDGLSRLKTLLAKVAEFTGIGINTFSINAREFELQLYVPIRQDLTDGEVFQRFLRLNPPVTPYMCREMEKIKRMFTERDPALSRWVVMQQARMYDVSAFMKTLNERFATWFNRKTGRCGPLFAGRFDSTMIDMTREWVSRACAAIDRLQLMSGSLEESAVPLSTGLGDALKGCSVARAGLLRAMEGEDWEDIVAEYHSLLYEQFDLEPPSPSAASPPLSDLLSARVVARNGMEIAERRATTLVVAVAWGSEKFVSAIRAIIMRRQRKMRVRRKLGLVPTAGKGAVAAVLRKINKGRRRMFL